MIAPALAGCGTFGQSPDVSSTARQGPSETVTIDPVVSGVDQRQPRQDREAFTASLDVRDQGSDGRSVTVASANIEETQGWVVVRRADGRSVLGHARVPAGGVARDIRVPLDPALEPGQHTLTATLHLDAEAVGDFEVPGSDEPLAEPGGDVVRGRFTLTVER